MTEEVITTPSPEVKEDTTVEEAVTEEPKLGEMLQHEELPKEEPKKETVGLDKFLDIKKQNKELKRKLEQLQSDSEDGSDVSEDIDSIAEEFNIDKSFLKKLEKSILSKRDKELDEKLSERLKPIEQAEKNKEVSNRFENVYTQTLERMPEYSNVINKDVVKSLAMLKENSMLSLPQLIEKIYGQSISGKKTIETTIPRGGKEPQEIDFSLAKKDTNYFAEIMANPELKKKYNASIENRLDL